MSAALSRKNSRKPREASEAGNEKNINHDEEVPVQEDMRDSQASSLRETPRENKLKTKSSLLPADVLPRSPRRGSSNVSDVSRKKSLLGDELKGSTAAAAAAGDVEAQRVQFSLSRLSLLEAKHGKDEGGQGRGLLVPPTRGSSPPSFVVNLTADWAGCQTLCSFIAADLGSKVALWTVESPTDPATFVMYDPKRTKLEDERTPAEQPLAALGVTLTPCCIKGIRGALLFGGRSPSGSILNDCLFYNAAGRKWMKLKCQGDKPPKRCFHAAAFSFKTQTLFVFGGQGEDAKPLAGTCKLVNAKEWVMFEDNEAPPPRTQHTLSVVEGATTGENLLLFGGLVDGYDTNDLWAFSLVSRKPSWHHIKDATGTTPTPRHGHTATVAGPRCFIFGGVGKHWMGWEVTYFDMYAYDIEVSTWFSVSMLSPMTDLPSHGLSVVTGDPSSVMHIFAAGDTSWKEGAIYRLAAVCSTLDIYLLAQNLRHVKVVSEDNKKQTQELRQTVDEIITTVEEEERLYDSISSKTEELATQCDSLTQSIDEAHSDVLKKLELAQELEAQAVAIASEAAARGAAAAERCNELQRQIEYFKNRVDEAEKAAEAASHQQQSHQQQSEVSDEEEGE